MAASKQVFHRDSLLEAFRRRKMLEYEGDMLFQGVHDEVLIRALVDDV